MMPRKIHPILSSPIRFFPIALLFYLTLTTHPPDIPVHFANFDKVEHATAFMMLLLWYAKSPRNKIHLILLGMILICIGISIEYLQDMVGRDFDYFDILADGIGVLIGTIIYLGTAIYLPINWIKAQFGIAAE